MQKLIDDVWSAAPQEPTLVGLIGLFVTVFVVLAIARVLRRPEDSARPWPRVPFVRIWGPRI